jgi:hypothetical protein
MLLAPEAQNRQTRDGGPLPERTPLNEEGNWERPDLKERYSPQRSPRLLQGLGGYPSGGRSCDPHGNSTIRRTLVRTQMLKQGLGGYCRGCQTGGTPANTHNVEIQKLFEAQARRSSVNTRLSKPRFEPGHGIDRSLEYESEIERMVKGSIASDRRL